MEADRRKFITTALGVAPMFIPRRVWGANDRLTYGLIASGGRGRYLNKNFMKLGAQCAAVCDVYDLNVATAVKETQTAQPDRQAPKTYLEYHQLLEQKDLDFVVCAGPDHHHCPMLLAALDAGKDIYSEKPLSKSLEQSAQMVAAARKSKQVVQIGMQRRSAEALMNAKKLVDDGILGRVTLVKPQWHWNVAKPLNNSALPGKLDWNLFLGSAPKRALEPMRFRYWRYFWDYAGGNMTDQGTHLMDVVQWFMQSGPPKSAVCYGYVAKMEGAEHPDVFSAVFEFEKFMATWTLDYSNSFQDGWAITFMGDKGTMILNDAGYKVYAEPWKAANAPVHEEKAPVPIEPHIQNFLDCIKSRATTHCPPEIAQQSVAGPHLANIALQQGRRAHLASDMVTVS